VLLYPQLPHQVAAHLTETLRRVDVSDLAARASVEHVDAVFTPTGGTRVGSEKLKELRDVLLEQALANGYPGSASDEQRSTFDTLASVALHTRMQVAPSEAARRGVWEFMTCVLAPDLVRWRFPGEGGETSAERFLTGRRNTFQRLWWRAHILRDDKREDNCYALVALLGEDEIVQIMERPSLAGYRRMTTHVATGLLSAMERHKHLSRRTLIREMQKHLLRLSSLIMLDGLEDQQLESLAFSLYEQIVASVSKAPGAAMVP
jgi:hypothetical protein